MSKTGLSLAEAHASGKNYRRPGWKCGFVTFNSHGSVPVEDALATDYELEPEAKLLTRDEVQHAFNISWSSQEQMYMRNVLLDILFGEGDDK